MKHYEVLLSTCMMSTFCNFKPRLHFGGKYFGHTFTPKWLSKTPTLQITACIWAKTVLFLQIKSGDIFPLLVPHGEIWISQQHSGYGVSRAQTIIGKSDSELWLSTRIFEIFVLLILKRKLKKCIFRCGKNITYSIDLNVGMSLHSHNSCLHKCP